MNAWTSCCACFIILSQTPYLEFGSGQRQCCNRFNKHLLFSWNWKSAIRVNRHVWNLFFAGHYLLQPATHHLTAVVLSRRRRKWQTIYAIRASPVLTQILYHRWGIPGVGIDCITDRESAVLTQIVSLMKSKIVAHKPSSGNTFC